jgi:hypothetical protein
VRLLDNEHGVELGLVAHDDVDDAEVRLVAAADD